jgi:hypothetical protein
MLAAATEEEEWIITLRQLPRRALRVPHPHQRVALRQGPPPGLRQLQSMMTMMTKMTMVPHQTTLHLILPLPTNQQIQATMMTMVILTQLMNTQLMNMQPMNTLQMTMQVIPTERTTLLLTLMEQMTILPLLLPNTTTILLVVGVSCLPFKRRKINSCSQCHKQGVV